MEAAQISMREANIRKIQDSEVKRAENENFHSQFLHEQQQETERLSTNRAMRLQAQAKLRQTLDQQLAAKERANQEIRKMDKQILSVGIKQEEQIENQRKAFFDKLKHVNERYGLHFIMIKINILV